MLHEICPLLHVAGSAAAHLQEALRSVMWRRVSAAAKRTWRASAVTGLLAPTVLIFQTDFLTVTPPVAFFGLFFASGVNWDSSTWTHITLRAARLASAFSTRLCATAPRDTPSTPSPPASPTVTPLLPGRPPPQES